MKKLMLAVAAIVAVSSLSLVSCGKKDPAAMAKAATETYVNAMKEAATSQDAEKAQKAVEEYTKAVEEAYKACKNAEDSAAVATAVQEAATAALGM